MSGLSALTSAAVSFSTEFHSMTASYTSTFLPSTIIILRCGYDDEILYKYTVATVQYALCMYTVYCCGYDAYTCCIATPTVVKLYSTQVLKTPQHCCANHTAHSSSHIHIRSQYCWYIATVHPPPNPSPSTRKKIQIL